MNYQLSISDKTKHKKRMKKKQRIDISNSLRRKRPDSVRTTVFVEGTACQIPRCRNVIYDGVCLEISPYNLLAVTTLRVPPKERNEPKMRKQLPMQSRV